MASRLHDAATVKRLSVSAVQLLCLVHLFNQHVAELRQTSGQSMAPTLSGHTNLLLVESLTRTFPSLRSLQRGDVVTAVNPVTSSHICKRIIATEGQTILAHVNRMPLPGPATSVSAADLLADEPKWVTVPKGHVWLAGDNPSHSLDSRHYGPVPVALVRGRVIASLWPQIINFSEAQQSYAAYREL